MDALKRKGEKFITEWYNFSNVGFFILLTLLYIVLLFLKRIFIIDSIAAFEILQERGEFWIIDLILGLQYLAVPVFLLWKFLLTTFILWIGCFMFGYKLTFWQLWKWVMFSELLFLIPEALKIIWFTVFTSEPTFQEYQAFYPFSLMNFFDYRSLDPRWHYPLKTLNLFEVAYWLILVSGIFILSGKKLNISAYVVLSSYVLFFFLWLIFYLFVYG